MMEKTHYALEGHAWYEGLPASPAVRAGDVLFVAAQVALGPDLQPLAAGDVRAQARHALDSVAGLVEAGGGTLADVIDVVSYHRDTRDIDAVLEVASDYFSADFPAWTPVGMVGSVTSDVLVAVRAVAHLGEEAKQCFVPDWYPWLERFPVSAACRKGDLVCVAGQNAAGPDGSLPSPFDHVAQSRIAYGRIQALAAAAGGSIDDALDFTSFHHDIRGAEPTLEQVYVNELYAGIDPLKAPTTSHIGVPALHQLGMLGTYRTLLDLSPGERVGVTPDSIWWKGVFPISGGARKSGGSLLTIAGQVPCSEEKAVVAPGDYEAQARYVFDCIREIVEAAGGTLDDVVEISSFHKDHRAGQIATGVAADYFGTDGGPAWTQLGVSGLWWEGYTCEVAGVAVV